MRTFVSSALLLFLVSGVCPAADGNRLNYLEDNDPWYPHQDFPKLITPQWVGEDGVEAVVILAIDDMRDSAKYENYLRPILQRLKQIDGRAPVSIMTCRATADDPQLKSWLEEGLSIEVHTVDHPCPLLQGGNFARARSTYDRCIDLLSTIPGNAPVAFRMPCCDSLNTVSPRFFEEIFNGTTENGRFLSISSSVFNVFTSSDDSIPRDLIRGEDGQERFRKYFPQGLKRGEAEHNNFVNWIENYPYPYVINGRCWEFPCMVPSDWEAQFLQQPNNPATVRDMQAALDITVHKQGVFNLVFHPHGWIKSEQVIELIDHAVKKHGEKVLFLTFREALERLNRSLLAGGSLRSKDGGDGGVRLLDLNADGYQDVVIGSESRRLTRVWRPRGRTWKETTFPVRLGDGVQFTLVRDDGHVSVLSETLEGPSADKPVLSETSSERAWHFDGEEWRVDEYLQQLAKYSRHIRFVPVERDDAAGPVHAPAARTWRFRDVDHDGRCEAFVSWQTKRTDGSLSPVERDGVAVFRPESTRPPNGSPPGQGPVPTWRHLKFAWPSGSLNAMAGHDPALFRFRDLDGDGNDDLIASTSAGTTVSLFEDFSGGWSRPVLNVARTHDKSLPEIIREDGTDNGFFIHSGNLCWQNEDTDQLPDLIVRKPIDELLAGRLAFESATRPNAPAVLIGASSIDITPDYPIRLSGYGSRMNESEGVAQRIHAKALVIGGDGKLLHQVDRSRFTTDHIRSKAELVTPELSVIVTVDNCGVPSSVADKVFNAVRDRFQLKRERFVICSTHSHTAPWLRDFAPLLFADVSDEHAATMARYEDELIHKLTTVIHEAIMHRRLGRLARAEGKATFARNRRMLQDGRWVGFGDVPDGPVDHRVPILVALDIHNRPLAVFANYACHCTTLSGRFNQISGDWATFAADMIEAELKPAVALIAIGAGADANPSPRGEHAMAEQHGREVAEAVLRSIRHGGPRFVADGDGFDAGSLTFIDPGPVCRLEHIDLPLGPIPEREHYEAEVEAGGVRAALAQKFLDMLNRGESIPTVVPDYPVSVWSFGEDLAMVFLGGEVVVDYAIRMSEMFDRDRVWLTAYTNAMPCYIPSKRILREGGYETDSSMRYYARPTRLAPETEDLILDTVQKLLPRQFYSEETQADFPPPVPPAKAVSTMQVRSGLRVELVASEPLIRDPVAFDWDLKGRLWVVEMGDYPNGEDDSGGRVQVLEDTDGDGQYDTAETFLDNIPFPTGIQRWRNGVLITAAPEIFYAEDTDGDGKADLRKTLYRGFAEGNQQHRVNGLRYGLDNWIHLANGDSGGQIASVDGVITDDDSFQSRSIAISGRDLRIRPDSGEMDPLSGQTQFGRNRDDWGNWFGCNNSRPLWHYVLADHYLRRNPHVPVRDTRREVPETPGAAPVFPASRTLARFNDFNKANRFTSACGTMIYRDTWLGRSFSGNAFTCEPVHNLISRLVLKQDGVTFTGRRAEDEQQSEFLASTDNWCRPVMIRTGPDGALWFADMYRFVIEHPKWIPAEWQRRLDLRAGSNMGRIYRIVPDTTAACCGNDNATQESIELRPWMTGSWNAVSAERLVQRLASPNGWWRDAAQRILVHRQETSVADALRTLTRTSQKPLTRLQALCTLDGLDAVDSETLIACLSDRHSGVQRHAIRLIESREDRHELLERVANPSVEDEFVALQLAYTAGSVDSPYAAALLARLAARYASNEWMQTAIASSLSEATVETFLQHLLQNKTVGQTLFARYLPVAAAFGRVDAIIAPTLSMLPAVDETMSAEKWTALVNVARSMRRHQSAWKTLTADDQWTAVSAVALRAAADSNVEVATRVAALGFAALSLSREEREVEQIVDLIDPRSPSGIQTAAVQAVATTGRDDVAGRLLAGWRNHSPTVRTAITDALLQRNAYRSTLLDAIERKDVAVSDLDASRREALLTGGPPELQARARKLFVTTTSVGRAEIIAQLTPALELAGSTERGQGVFQKRCSACHRLKGIGKTVGANLATLRDRSGSALLTAILDPNRAVEAKFLNYTAVTESGKSFSGMLLSETGNSITLIGVDGKEHVLLRQELETLVATKRSLMPEGLEKDLTPQDLADVIAFVQSEGSPFKSFPGNSPATIRATADGTLTLPAKSAEIFGPNLVFETKYSNLGFWHTRDDYAVWTIEVSASGTFEVELDFACDNGTAGNVLMLSTAGRELRGSVPGTGTWDDYRKWTPGRIDLRRGANRVTVSAPLPPAGYVIDLRSIRLKPIK